MIAEALHKGDDIIEVDEMRLGLQGRVRRVWASRGVKVVQKVQFVFEWTYLLLGVNPVTGKLIWDWIDSMKQVDLLPALAKGSLDAVIWDRAPSHRGQQGARYPSHASFNRPTPQS